ELQLAVFRQLLVDGARPILGLSGGTVFLLPLTNTFPQPQNLHLIGGRFVFTGALILWLVSAVLSICGGVVGGLSGYPNAVVKHALKWFSAALGQRRILVQLSEDLFQKREGLFWLCRCHALGFTQDAAHFGLGFLGRHFA